MTLSRHTTFGENAYRLSVAVFSVTMLVGPFGCASQLERRFQEHIDYLASDELGGRGVGTPGIELAAAYIAGEFERMGLAPAGDDGTYFSTFSLTLNRELTDECRLAFSGDSEPRQVNVDFVPFSFSSNDAFEGGITFCGYGIAVPEKEYDDFDGVDLEGNVALFLRGEPARWADADGYPTRHASLRNKIYNAKDRGAVAAVFVNQKPEDGEADPLAPFRGRGADAYGLPAFQITRAMADEMLAAGGMASLDELQERLDAGSHASGWLAHTTMSGQAGFKKITAPTRNVLARLEGAGPDANEYVVIGAHYDHLGERVPMMRRFKAGKLVSVEEKPQIHNGADDNASGVSGLIEIARLFVEGEPPNRSILFAAFSAEESGVHGSNHYIDHPAVPLEDTVAMLNMDMIGRMKRGRSSLEVFGVRSGAGLEEILREEAEELGLDALPTAYTGGRSDHGPFVRKQIAGMHFFTGHHADYHKPTDDPDRINARAGAKVARLVYRMGRRIAALETRPAFVEVKPPKRKDKGDGPMPTYRVVMGLAPGYADDGEPGMKVEAVTPEGPADVAGMQAEDRIIGINDKPVANIYDYMAATRNNDPGDAVVVVVLRDGKEVTLQVTLAPAR